MEQMGVSSFMQDHIGVARSHGQKTGRPVSAKPIVVMDAGIATDKNIALLKAGDTIICV